MMRRIIAVDYDGTLEVNGKLNLHLIERLRRENAIVILWTCREGERLASAVRKLLEAGFRPHYVNCNCPQGIARMGHDSRKVFADIYIDDKNARF